MKITNELMKKIDSGFEAFRQKGFRKSWIDRLIYSDQMEHMDDPKTSDKIKAHLRAALVRANQLFGVNRITEHYLDRFYADQRKGRSLKKIKALEVGVGGGGFAMVLKQWGKAHDIETEHHGLDISSATIRYTRDFLKDKGLDSKLLVGDATKLMTHKENAYDLVISLSVAHHIRKPSELVKMMLGMYHVAKHTWMIGDLTRNLLSLSIMLPGLFLGHPYFMVDGIRSARRAYTIPEMKFLLKKAQAMQTMDVTIEEMAVLPAWVIYGKKSHAA